MTDKIERIDNYVFDERYYRRITESGEEFRPSLTHVIGCTYPTDFGLVQWRGDVGNKRADEILEETSADGSYVHESIEKILKGGFVDREEIEGRFSPKRSLKIMRCLKAFLDWHAEYKPQTIATEYIVWHDSFAGTVDYKCVIGGKTYLVDFKTSKAIHGTHKVQICGYNMADPSTELAILQLGNTTKKKYSFLVLDNDDKEKYTKECTKMLEMFHTLYPNAKPSEEKFPDQFII